MAAPPARRRKTMVSESVEDTCDGRFAPETSASAEINKPVELPKGPHVRAVVTRPRILQMIFDILSTVSTSTTLVFNSKGMIHADQTPRGTMVMYVNAFRDETNPNVYSCNTNYMVVVDPTQVKAAFSFNKNSVYTMTITGEMPTYMTITETDGVLTQVTRISFLNAESSMRNIEDGQYSMHLDMNTDLLNQLLKRIQNYYRRNQSGADEVFTLSMEDGALRLNASHFNNAIDLSVIENADSTSGVKVTQLDMATKTALFKKTYSLSLFITVVSKMATVFEYLKIFIPDTDGADGDAATAASDGNSDDGELKTSLKDVLCIQAEIQGCLLRFFIASRLEEDDD